MIFFVMIFKVSKNIKTLRALSIFLIILLPFLSLEVCGLSEGKVLIQLSYGNVTTFDMGGQQGNVSGSLADYHKRIILRITDRQTDRQSKQHNTNPP